MYYGIQIYFILLGFANFNENLRDKLTDFLNRFKNEKRDKLTDFLNSNINKKRDKLTNLENYQKTTLILHKRFIKFKIFSHHSSIGKVGRFIHKDNLLLIL